jgi:nicotinamidase-related amidase
MTDALLLMDIQNGTVGRFGAGDDYLDRVVAAQATAEAVGIPVILVRVGFRPGYPEISPRTAGFSAIRSSGRMQLGDREGPASPWNRCWLHARSAVR